MKHRSGCEYVAEADDSFCRKCGAPREEKSLLHRVVPGDPDEVGASIADGFGEIEKKDQCVAVVLLPEKLRSQVSDAAEDDELWGARLIVVSGLSHPILVGTAPVVEPPVEKKTALPRSRDLDSETSGDGAVDPHEG